MSPGTASGVVSPDAVLPAKDRTVNANEESPRPWLWQDRHGALSCGAHDCILPRRMYHVLNAAELAELGAMAKAHRTTLRCRCGAVEYDLASRTVRERIERTEP